MERIHVSVRARPLSAEDAKTSPWRISGNSIFIPNHSSKFEFDLIFGEDCRTKEVYEARTKDIVAAAVRGFNGTVFAYGQTNSGKTHTMRGSAIEPGVIPLSVFHLFDTIEKEKDREFLLRMSYMEIYNEEINDLLAPDHRKLQIHENLERGIHVAGLQEEIVTSPDQVIQLMGAGESHRHIGETNMNVYSSRSHTIFRMIIESRDIHQRRITGSGDKNEDEDGYTSCDAVRVSVLNLVDLAGSERAAKTGAEGVRLKEGSHINKSLMTLGTVIKKLSEGVESHGGHVPYRDSKLTRILQPALGGNSNTAIICNITLAQIHADETKSSLQFASRAIRVTNHAHVNEILTDAALLKRQKKEIEELRAKLQGFHSEHLEEDILNLRNRLLQTELERERIALELEEEKRAQAERDRKLQEQAKKIENLSTMMLYSSRDENRENIKKGKRRDTWCPSALSRETIGEAHATVDVKATATKTASYERTMGPLLPFEELVDITEDGVDNSYKLQEGYGHNDQGSSNIPNPQSLMHVTSRRKTSKRNTIVAKENINHVEVPVVYEDLLEELEGQRIANEIQIHCLMRKFAEVDSSSMIRPTDGTTACEQPEPEFVINQLQEKIKTLEMEKTLNNYNHDAFVELAEGQTISDKKSDELHEELLKAKEEARLAHEKLTSMKIPVEIYLDEIDTLGKLSIDVEDMALEVQNMKKFVEEINSLVDDVFQTFSAKTCDFLDLKALVRQTIQQQNQIITNSDKSQSCLYQKISELENDKVQLQRHIDDIEKQTAELKKDMHYSEKGIIELKEQHESEMLELLSQVQILQKENSSLSSSVLAKERESLRKELEKTKLKLKETEFKLKNAVQEKTKLEGEKASAEREIKLLHGQKVLLERDINKRESIAGRRRDSIMVESKKTRSQADWTIQEEYRQLEVLAFEMESTIASLEEQLAAAKHENEALFSQNESLASDLEVQSEKMELFNSELRNLHEEVNKLNLKLEESTSYKNKLAEEKEELAMQLSESLMEIEEEKAIWCSKETASLKALEENSKLNSAEISSLMNEIEKVRMELQSCKERCNTLTERLKRSEQDLDLEKQCSLDKTGEIERLKNDLESAVQENKQALKEKSDNSKGMANFRISLRWTQAKLDAIRLRYVELLNDKELMDRKYKEASAELKGLLQQYVTENIRLKEQLAAADNRPLI